MLWCYDMMLTSRLECYKVWKTCVEWSDMHQSSTEANVISALMWKIWSEKPNMAIYKVQSGRISTKVNHCIAFCDYIVWCEQNFTLCSLPYQLL